MASKLFKDFSELSTATKDVLASLGFERATPVQQATIPLFVGHKDVAVDACTGSGKTLAFVIPIIEKMRRLELPLRMNEVGAVVISPTRELARQIHEVMHPFAASLPWLRTSLLVGGTDPVKDIDHLHSHGAHVLVGTPGRLDDILQRCAFLDLKTVEVLVLDEADRLLDMGFKRQVDSVMARLPRQRRTGLFSATQTEAVEALARAGLRNPVRVAVAVSVSRNEISNNGVSGSGMPGKKEDGDARPEQVTPFSLKLLYSIVPTGEKLPRLIEFLNPRASEKIIVYFLTCACVDYFSIILPRLHAALEKRNLITGTSQRLPVFYSLHGRMKQVARENTLAAFASASSGVLLATDVAARGLDIPAVHWVVQYDAPQDPASFVHRSGRTARMGRAGSALAILTPAEASYVEFLRLRKVPMAELDGNAFGGVTQENEGRRYSGEDNATTVAGLLRRESEGDRQVMEAGIKAFVSYVRAYKEHQCKYIFRLDDVEIGHLASMFALLRLPRMGELKKTSRALACDAHALEGFVPSTLDPDDVKFKDKGRERQRQAALKEKKASNLAAIGTVQATIKGDDGGGGKKGVNAQTVVKTKVRSVALPKLPVAKRRQLEARQEFLELQDEYALLKKLKKGKISEREYDAATGVASDDDEDEQPAEDDTRNHVKRFRENLVEDAAKKKAKRKKKKERRRATSRKA